MTPAVRVLEQAGIPFRLHRFDAEPGDKGYGLAAAQALGLNPEQVFKTLMIHHGDQLACVMVPVNGQVNLKKAAKALGWKRAQMADVALAERETGYIVGGISPLGQRKRHRRLLDHSAQAFDVIYCSGGQRGLDIEIAPQSLIDCGVKWASLADFSA